MGKGDLDRRRLRVDEVAVDKGTYHGNQAGCQEEATFKSFLLYRGSSIKDCCLEKIVAAWSRWVRLSEFEDDGPKIVVKGGDEATLIIG